MDDDDGPLVEFAAAMRDLRTRAGKPTYRELSHRAHYSAAALSDAAAGRRLPSLSVTLAYVAACGGDEAAWEHRWRDLAAKLAGPPSADDLSDDTVSPAPYVGLRAFQVEDADRFFGREQLVAELAGRVTERRVVVVVGPSGSGKSSLLRAGLLHEARTRGVCATAAGPTVLMTPASRPLWECAARLAGLVGRTPSEVHDALRADAQCLHLTAQQTLVGHPADAQLLVVVDQFEEVFTLCGDEEQRSQFLKLLMTAAHAENSRTRVVLGLRADFYAHCAHYPDLVEALRHGQVVVGPMTTEDLRAAITQPALGVGCRLETALVSQVVAEATGQPGALPLISHALLQTWRRRRGNALTLAGYQAAGGIAQSITQTAETVYTSLNDEQQRTARQVFGRLVALGEGTQDTKRRIPRGELDLNPATAAVVDAMTRARLLTVDAGSVEIAHEALIRSWPRLRDWLAEDRDGLRTHRKLTEAAQAWDSLDRDPGALYRGTRLDMACDWADDPRWRDNLNALEQDFLHASDRETRRRTRRQRQVTAALAVLLVSALAATWMAFAQRQIALEQRRTALVGKLIAQSAPLADGQPDASMLLAVEAFHQDPALVEARSALLSSQSHHFTARLGHTSPFVGVAFSPDGRTLAAGSRDRTVRLWNVATRKEFAVLTGHTGQVFAVAFSPDGRILATTGNDASVRLWDVASRKEIVALTGHTKAVWEVAFSPDGRMLATSSGDASVRLWDTANHKETAVLTGHTGQVFGVAFSPDNRTLATSSGDASVRLWDTANHKETAVLTGHTGQVFGVAFSPDNRTLATSSGDASVRLWDTANHKETAVLTGHTGDVLAVAFSPDGRTLATATSDSRVRLWATANHTLTATLTGHTGQIHAVAFSPDGRTLASASNDNTAVLWDMNGPILTPSPVAPGLAVDFSSDGRTLAAGGRDRMVRLWDMAGRTEIAALTGHTGQIYAVAFSPDNRVLATADSDASVRLWDTASGKEIAVLTGHTSEVFAVAFSPDGRTLATASDDKTVRLWDVVSHTLNATLTDSAGEVYTVAFSPDGRTLATAGSEAVVRLWDMTTLKEIITLTGHTKAVSAVAFSPDGRTLATTSNDATVRLWDVASRNEVATMTGHNGQVYAVAFSPDGRTLATTSSDASVRLWNATSGTLTATLIGHTSDVLQVAFSPDGRTLATTSGDGTIRLWDPDPARVVTRICQVIGPISPARWEQLMPELEYQPICS
ncbi:WD40 repeat domain-containing protein [Kibdelosporangium phytohabitans]|uniref:HTH cro/C1-type domain-containing protein n=1 Tax=Kibdelosporangium phytohabitans TaxID=860235 RepID=A0A0N9HT19_9PSEU|nr:WD40 repeat domain-containing protein [Kibdelosporangium phytohabitans]ALG08195.1 hypothetical protein AOZ06_15915 [Kibdelosporangium phytohabitans]MBE1470802.1 WD40 repeat protein/energy-coupling factor transporter ATP-binding protein EcfA2 [Kibdelosporangium phytohabitans]